MPQATTAPAISVMLPASSAKSGLLASVRSMLGQDREDFELLVIGGNGLDGMFFFQP